MEGRTRRDGLAVAKQLSASPTMLALGSVGWKRRDGQERILLTASRACVTRVPMLWCPAVKGRLLPTGTGWVRLDGGSGRYL